MFVGSSTVPLPPNILPIVGTPNATLFVHGEVRYRDIFSTERFVKYRLMHGGNEPTENIVEGNEQKWFLKPDAEGNESN
jgi:hypothetical protein